MSEPIKWKTPDGKRPGIYYTMTVIWRSGPPWLPFLFAIFFLFVAWTSGLLYLTFGPDADLNHITKTNGEFQKRLSLKSPYTLVESNGRIIRLVCQPRMAKNFCINSPIDQLGEVSIIYTPFKQSILKEDDGVIIEVTAPSSRVIFKNKDFSLLNNDRDEQNQPIWLRILSYTTNIPLLLVSILLAFGLVDGAIRMLNMKKRG